MGLRTKLKNLRKLSGVDLSHRIDTRAMIRPRGGFNNQIKTYEATPWHQNEAIASLLGQLLYSLAVLLYRTNHLEKIFGINLSLRIDARAMIGLRSGSNNQIKAYKNFPWHENKPSHRISCNDYAS